MFKLPFCPAFLVLLRHRSTVIDLIWVFQNGEFTREISEDLLVAEIYGRYDCMTDFFPKSARHPQKKQGCSRKNLHLRVNDIRCRIELVEQNWTVT